MVICVKRWEKVGIMLKREVKRAASLLSFVSMFASIYLNRLCSSISCFLLCFILFLYLYPLTFRLAYSPPASNTPTRETKMVLLFLLFHLSIFFR